MLPLRVSAAGTKVEVDVSSGNAVATEVKRVSVTVDSVTVSVATTRVTTSVVAVPPSLSITTGSHAVINTAIPDSTVPARMTVLGKLERL